MSGWYGPELSPGKPTKRELHVLAMQLRYGQKVAGNKIGIASQTVKNHMNSLYAKLEVDNASQAAIALGWLCIPSDLPDCDTPEMERVLPIYEVEERAERIARATYNYVLAEVEQECRAIRRESYTEGATGEVRTK